MKRLKPFETLTPRHRQVLAKVAEGMTNRQIGKALGISERTVQNHYCDRDDKLTTTRA